MKISSLSFIVWIALAGGLTAAAQDYPVTPATLADWQINGAEHSTLQAQDTLSLPAGAELVRSFPVGAVVLHSVSRPVFSSAPADWPVVQVGPAALALTRQGDHGQVALLVGETVQILPVAVQLDAAGRSLQPLELALGYDPVTKTGLVAFADQVFNFHDTANRSVVEVSVSAGEQSPWAQDSLAVSVLGLDLPTVATGAPHGTVEANRLALLQSFTSRFRQTGKVLDTSSGTSPDTKAPQAAAPAAGAAPTLEIFTPPSVRQGPAAVRAAIARSQQK